MPVLMFFSHMMKKGIATNTRTFNILIHSLCKEGKLQLAQRMVGSGGFVADVVTYNILLHWFYQNGKAQKVNFLLSSMGAENIAQDAVTHTIMINWLCQEGKFLEATNCCLKSLEGRFDRKMVALLIKRLETNGRISEILHLIKGMTSQNCFPDGFLRDISIRTLCKAGFCRSERIHHISLVLENLLRRG